MSDEADDVRISIRIPREYRESLEKEAAADDRTMSQLIRRILRDHLQKVPAKP